MNLSKPYLIAEIGINHNGSVRLAKKLIDLAVKNNFDAVKFQKRDPDKSTPEEQKNIIRQTPWGEITYLDYKKKIEFGNREYQEIDRYCKKMKIDWFVSCWDIESIEFMKKYKVKYNKIASAMLTNIPLLEAVAKQKIKTLISTGMSSLRDIDNAINIFKKNKCPYVIMHCVSKYPCPDLNINLQRIEKLKKISPKAKVGISDHSPDILSTLYSLPLGVQLIEKHFTIDNKLPGRDNKFAILPKELKLLCDNVLRFQKMQKPNKKLTKEEVEVRKVYSGRWTKL